MGKALPDEVSCMRIGLVQACPFLEMKVALVFYFCDASDLCKWTALQVKWKFDGISGILLLVTHVVGSSIFILRKEFEFFGILGADVDTLLEGLFRALDKGEYLMILGLILHKTYVVTHHLNRLDETVQMRSYNIWC